MAGFDLMFLLIAFGAATMGIVGFVVTLGYWLTQGRILEAEVLSRRLQLAAREAGIAVGASPLDFSHRRPLGVAFGPSRRVFSSIRQVCNLNAESYAYYFSQAVSLETPKFLSRLAKGLQDPPASLQVQDVYRWSCTVDIFKDRDLVHNMLERLAALALERVPSPTYLVGLTSVGAMFATYLASRYPNARVLTYPMVPQGLGKDKGGVLLLVDVAVNGGATLSTAAAWVENLYSEVAETWAIIVVYNDTMIETTRYPVVRQMIESSRLLHVASVGDIAKYRKEQG